MTRREEITGAIILAALGVVIIAILSMKKPGIIPEREQKSLDSMRITQRAYEISRDTLIQHETVYVRRVDTLMRRVQAATVGADVAHRLADSLAFSAEDIASQWHAAYTARTVEADSLRSALLLTFAAETTQRHARMLSDARADAADMRVMALNNLSERLAKDVQRATECKFLWMRCPTRASIAVTTLIIGAVGGYTAHRP